MANKVTSGCVWYNWPGRGCQQAYQLSAASLPEDQPYDIAVIGAGVVGTAIAYELSQYHLRTVLIDKAFDVGEGTSKGNSAIIHTGFDATPGSLESELVTRASRIWPALAEKLRIPFKPVGALMLALNKEQQDKLPEIREKALANGVDDVQLLTAEQIRDLEPHTSPAVRGGLLVPRESIIDPFGVSIAFWEVARTNGVDTILGLEIEDVEATGDGFCLLGDNGDVRIPARLIINASGLGSRRLVDSYGGEKMDINPRRGQFVVYDNQCSGLVSRILLPIPTPTTKGMLVSPTIFGNLFAGPTAEDLPPGENRATNTTIEGLKQVRDSGIRMCPKLAHQQVIATYAGLRANCSQGSYWVRYNDGHPGIVTLAGIRSTGLTSSITTAQHVIAGARESCGLKLEKNPDAVDYRSEDKWPGWWRHPFQDAERVNSNGDYGRITCSCENISYGEIADVLAVLPGVATLDGIKRRTRAMTGRCQGFNCCVPIAEAISRHFDIPLGSVTKKGPGTAFISTSGGQPRAKSGAPVDLDSTQNLHYKAVVVGAGPAGMGAAIGLANKGIRPVLLVDRAPGIGGIPAKYKAKADGIPTFLAWKQGRILYGEQYVELLRKKLESSETTVWLNSQVIGADTASHTLDVVCQGKGQLQVTAEAVVFACGAREASLSERDGVAGFRVARQHFTANLLDVLDGCDVLPMENPAIIGSDVIAYAAAAKLRAAGSKEAPIVGADARPIASFWERLWFKRWARPKWIGRVEKLEIPDLDSGAIPANGEFLAGCDGLAICGDLLPNSELVSNAGMEVDGQTRVPVVRNRGRLSEPGWFVAGAVQGGFRGAERCYNEGRRAAVEVASYLRGTST